MRLKLLAAVVAASVIATVPSTAFAGDRDNARVAIAGAKAKIDLNERNGITGEAAQTQARARMALEKAEMQFKKSNEDSAIAAAKEADSLADLASATQQKQLVESTAQIAPQ